MVVFLLLQQAQAAAPCKAMPGGSGSVGADSSGGKGGLIQILSMSGVITTVGLVNAPGGSASGNQSKTGNGGTSANGDGGASGNIDIGGSGGKGGTVMIGTGGLITSEEAIIAAGGNDATQTYNPMTGNGGNGTTIGGSSGSIGAAGSGGQGGIININSTAGNISLDDRLNANGGISGFSSPFLNYSTPMQGQTGNGGTGAIGGKAGSVGNAVTGGDGGMITVTADLSIALSVAFNANGGYGGAEQGLGGTGGQGTSTGGAGGAVGAGGNGGAGGTITLTAVIGPSINIRDLTAIGGAGGDNTGTAGNGGDATGGLGNGGGAGGAIGAAGTGGKGRSASASVINLALSTAANITDVARTADINF